VSELDALSSKPEPTMREGNSYEVGAKPLRGSSGPVRQVSVLHVVLLLTFIASVVLIGAVGS